MSGFYRRPPLDAPLTQGDIFIGVPMIGVSLEPMYRVLPSGDTFKLESVEPDKITDDMLLVELVRLTKAIVISQSCDAERAQGIMLAPVIDFNMEGRKKVSDQWRKINLQATSLAETKFVYLPGNPHLKLPRSTADFGDAFTLPRTFLVELAKRGRRIAGLGEKAIAYLQFRLNVMLTRVAQDDYAWPSCEDIDIKLAHLGEQIEEATKKANQAQQALTAATPDTKDQCEEEHGRRQEILTDLQAQLTQATESRKTADDLAD